MPRVYFTGRRKIQRSCITISLVHGDILGFRVAVDLSRFPRRLPRLARVVIEAYHNTMIQRFDFGTLADFGPREPLLLSRFDAFDCPRFRLLVVWNEPEPGLVIAVCDSLDAIEPDAGGQGGRSLLRLLPQPEARMRGEFWRIHESSNTFQLWYNRDVPQVATAIKAKDPLLLGLILPAAVREILTRTHLAGGVAVEPTEWTGYGMTVSGEPFPAGHDGEEPSRDEIEEWIDGVVSTFSTKTARFRERLLAVSEDAP